MHNNWFEEMAARYSALFAPAQRLQALTLEHMAAFADFHLSIARSYASLGFDQARALYRVRDPRSWQDYLRSQSRFAHTLEEQIAQDLDALGAMSREFANEVDEATRSNVIPFTEPPHLKAKNHGA